MQFPYHRWGHSFSCSLITRTHLSDSPFDDQSQHTRGLSFKMMSDYPTLAPPIGAPPPPCPDSICSFCVSSHRPFPPLPRLSMSGFLNVFRTFHFKLNIFSCCRPQGLPGHPGPTSWMARDAGDSHPPPSYDQARDPRPDLSIPHKTSRHPHETLARDRMYTTKDIGGDNVRGRWSECTFSTPSHQLKAHASPQQRRCIFLCR